MAKLTKKHNKSIVFIIPILLLVVFIMLLTYSYASFHSYKLFSFVSSYFVGNRYTLTYNVAGCSSKTIRNGFTYGTLCTPPTIAGATFDGWYLGDNKITTSSLVRTSANVNLVAHYNADCEALLSTVQNISYSGNIDSYIAACPGIYQIESWGAQGGVYGVSLYGGYGGYAIGTTELDSDDVLYTVVGGSGNTVTSFSQDIEGGYNGGGYSFHWHSNNVYQTSGGGATHIATINYGLLSNYETHQSDLLMVAGAGGGAAFGDKQNFMGGSGGGYQGTDGEYRTPENYSHEYNEDFIDDNSTYGLGGTQLAGGSFVKGTGKWAAAAGSFGQGGASIQTTGGASGGAGYFGGGGAAGHDGAGGGSGYIGNNNLDNKHMTCFNCTTSNDAGTKTNTTTCHSSSPLFDCAKEGNGHVRITYLGSTGTKPTFGAKTITSEVVSLVVNANNQNVTNTICLYGDNEASVTSLGSLNSNSCVFPSTASYARVCVTVNNTPICSDVKKLADYFIKNGVPNDTYTIGNGLATASLEDGYFNIAKSSQTNTLRTGVIFDTKRDFSIYKHAYLDFSYSFETYADTSPSFRVLVADDNWFTELDSHNIGYGVYSYPNLTNGYTETGDRQIRSNSMSLGVATDDYLQIGSNKSAQTYDVKIYNLWFQLTN